VETDCIFCKIAGGEIPAKRAYRSPNVVAIDDLNPQAPRHVLVMPVAHYANLGALVDAGDAAVVAELFEAAAKLGRERGGDDGYRLVVNTGRNGGQTVEHVHVHVLAGRPMSWPPG
jgi:histidine triad (HIT) family protein